MTRKAMLAVDDAGLASASRPAAAAELRPSFARALAARRRLRSNGALGLDLWQTLEQMLGPRVTANEVEIQAALRVATEDAIRGITDWRRSWRLRASGSAAEVIQVRQILRC
jgi:hypothetical protein